MVQRERWISQALQETASVRRKERKIMTSRTIKAFFPQAWFLNVLTVAYNMLGNSRLLFMGEHSSWTSGKCGLNASIVLILAILFLFCFVFNFNSFKVFETLRFAGRWWRTPSFSPSFWETETGGSA